MVGRIRCEKVQTHQVPANGESHPVVIYHLGHFSSRPAIQASRGQWMLALHFGAVQSLDAHLSKAAEEQKLPGPTPLWHFAPYRIGADQRPDVIAERLCKYLEHVLKFTEAPAPKDLVQIFDDFITTYWVGNLEHTLKVATSIAVRTPPTPRTAGKLAVSDFLGRVRPGHQLQDTPDMPSLRRAMERFKSLQAAGSQLTQAELLSAVWSRRPFIEVVPASKVPQDACPLCKRHLRQKETGCIRLRTCGHSLHGECFNALMSGSNRFPGVPRTGCPKCGECWAEWAVLDNQRCQTPAEGAVCAERKNLSTLLALGMTSRGTWGHKARDLQ